MIYKLFKAFDGIDDVVDAQSEVMTQVIDEVVAPQLPLFSDFGQIAEIVRIAHEIGVMQQSFWKSVGHTIAVYHMDMDVDEVVHLMYLLYSHDVHSKMQINKDYIEGSDMQKEKVFQRLSFENVLKSIRHDVAVEVRDLESSTAFRVVNLMQILYLSSVAKLELLPEEFSEEKLLLHLDKLITGNLSMDESESKEIEVVDDYVDTLSQFSKDFK